MLVDHIKDAHNDLIFHCEMCDDYVARVDLISHMLNHALNSNSLVKEEDSAQVEEVRPDSPKKPLPKVTAEELPPKNKTVPEKQNVPPKINEIPVKTSTPKIRAQNYCSECDKTYVDQAQTSTKFIIKYEIYKCS